MAETGGREVSFYSLHPFIGKNFTTGIAEAGFAGVRNNDILTGMLWTSIFMIAQLARITAKEHFVDCGNDIRGKREPVLG